MERYYSKVSRNLSKSSLTPQNSFNLEEENSNELEQGRQSERVDITSLKFNPGERLPIRKYHPNERDAIRRMYLQNGPFQPKNHQFP